MVNYSIYTKEYSLPKKFPDVVKGTFKTILGLLILSAGAGLIVQNLLPFAGMFTEGFNLIGVVPFDEAVIGALIDNVAVIARTTSLILALGFVVNVILARITPFKYIFLTGHMMWIMAGALAWAMYDMGVSETNTIIFGSLLQGAILVLLPAMAQPIMRKVTGSDEFAYGHLTTIGVVASAYVGKLFGDPEKSSEDIKVPEALNFFKDTAISVSFVMVLVYLITALFAGPEFVAQFAGEQHYLVFSLLKGLGFAAGVLILLQGVRMFLGEIVPAFRGIALKIVPGAKPALDVPVLFPYAPNALMLGFIFAVAGTVVGMFTSRLVGTVVLVPSIIGAFFTGGVAGIFGNALGGRRGAMISGFVYGLFLSIPVALFFPLFGLAEYGVTGVAFLVSDGIAALSIMWAFFAAGIPAIGFGLFVVAFGLLSWKFWNRKTRNKNTAA
jgi:PTS system ascorbate-specific IIC component